MALTAHTSTQLERLHDALAERPRPRDPFQAEWVVVQSRRAAAPLLAAIGLRRGIAAHIETPTTARFLELLATSVGLVEDHSSGGWDFTRGGLTAALCKSILARRGDPRFVSFAWAQLAPTPSFTVTGTLFALAKELSATFERYSRHWPSLLDDWIDGAEPDDWQATLWRDVSTSLATQLPHQRLAQLAVAIRDGAPLPASLPQRIAIVGHRTVDPLQLDVLLALGTRIEVDLFMLASPAATVSFRAFVRRSDRVGDRLLTSLPAESVTRLDARPRHATLLGGLQDRLDGRNTIVSRAGDESLQFHGCVGPIAQVERARDIILNALNADPTLQPRDIQVATPNMGLFAPLIETIFAETLPAVEPGDRAPPPLLSRLTDVPEERRNPLAAALGAAFDLADSRLDVHSVSMFLGQPLIMRALELDDDTLRACRSWFDGATIRWGRDEHHRRAVGQPAVRLHTWRHGFDRLLLGYAFADGIDTSRGAVDDFAPVAGVEGSKVPDLGRCIDFLVQLFDLFETMAEPAPIEAWHALIVRMTRLLAGSHPDAPTLLQDTWAMLSELDRGLEASFDLGAIRLQLQTLLRVGRVLPSFQAGGITVTDLAPDRASPRRLVLLLGVDDGTLGGERTQAAFNRLATPSESHTYQAGDDARLGLFEFILSARETLAILWDTSASGVGNQAQPAAPVQELQRQLAGLQAPPQKGRTQTTPTWAPKSAASAAPLPRTAVWPAGMPIPQDDGADPARHIRLRDLVALLMNPHKALAKDVLGIKLLVPERPPIREPIEPNHLEKFPIAERLIALYLNGVAPTQARRIFRAEGHLPYGNAGDIVFDDLHHKALATAMALADLVDERTTARDQRFPLPLTHARVDFSLGGSTVTGVLGGLVTAAEPETHPNASPLRLLWRSGKLRPQDEIKLWVEHLALTLSAVRAPTSIYVTRSPDSSARIGVYTLPPLPRALAAREMTALVALHARHLRSITDFYPATGRGFASAVERAAAQRGEPNLRAAAADWYQAKAYGGDSPGGDSLEPHGVFLTSGSRSGDYPFDHEDFRETSLRVFAPIAAWLQHGRR